MKSLSMLAFDLGASNGRALLGQFDGNRLTVEELYRFANEPVRVVGSLYWDILRLYHEIQQGIRAAFGKTRQLDCLGIDSWGVDYGLLDREGRLLGNPYHYRDNRTRLGEERAFSKVSKRDIYFRTGISFEKFNTMFQLVAEKECGDALERAKSLLFISDFVGYFLTGEINTDSTMASTSQLVDVQTRMWSRELLAALGIPERIFPKIVTPGTMKGRISPLLDDSRAVGLPVVTVAGHDTASALAAVPLIASAGSTGGRNAAFLSSGTWSLMGVEVDEPIINEETFELNYSNEKTLGGYTLLRNIVGGWLIQECRQQWEEEEGRGLSYEEIALAAQEATPFLAFVDPNAAMFYSPGAMPAKIVAYCRKTGQAVPDSRGTIARCIYESLAMTYRKSFLEIEAILGRTLDTLYIIGGGANNAMLNQFTANALGRPVVCGPVEATAIGNLLTQALALGELEGLGQLREVVYRSFASTTYLPEDIGHWEQQYHRFTSLLESAKGE